MKWLGNRASLIDVVRDETYPALVSSRPECLMYTAACAQPIDAFIVHIIDQGTDQTCSCVSQPGVRGMTTLWLPTSPNPPLSKSLHTAPRPPPQRIIIKRLPQDLQFYATLPKHALPLLYQRRAPRQFFSFRPFVTHYAVKLN